MGPFDRRSGELQTAWTFHKTSNFSGLFPALFSVNQPDLNLNNTMADEEYDFASADAGASETFPMQCSALRKNGFVMIKSRPCKIVEMSTSKTGKHGHAKVHMVALDIFTGKKYEDICPSTHNMNVPNVTRKDYQLVDIDDESLSLMDDAGELKDDMNMPSNAELAKSIRDAHEADDPIMVTVLSAIGTEQVIGIKNVK